MVESLENAYTFSSTWFSNPAGLAFSDHDTTSSATHVVTFRCHIDGLKDDLEGNLLNRLQIDFPVVLKQVVSHFALALVVWAPGPDFLVVVLDHWPDDPRVGRRVLVS